MQWDLAAGDKSISLPTPLPRSTTTNPIPSHLIHFSLPSSWQHLMSSRPSQWSLSGISSSVLDHAPRSHLIVLFAGSLGADLCSLSPVKPGQHYLISPSLRRHGSPSLKSGWVIPLLQGEVDKQSPGYALNKNYRCSSLAAMLDNCLDAIASHLQKHIKVLQFCFTLTVAFKEPFYHSFV